MADIASTDEIADRYATALLDLALEQNAADAVAADVDMLAGAIDESADLRELLMSPLYRREQQGQGLSAVAGAMGLGALVANTALLMASKRRSFRIRAMLARFRALLAEHRGEVTAAVTSARPLSDTQREALAGALKASLGRDVALDLSVDEGIIGGLIVKVGSRMIDSSIRSQLNRLQHS
ncbi:MAG: F0F1 ATP synthase subunit delta, partial [Pseudomonadota bacterium]